MKRRRKENGKENGRKWKWKMENEVLSRTTSKISDTIVKREKDSFK